ncbi:prostaglandin reductase 1-like [Zerene cesonia]|uniref:prostaglandin reductase 1-like n=1 Tax=Zerene cesonia TaxID=33412 RepID=UPI0018E4EFB0|nr:prostaglandin reductase 1-like [Zerene cesonia]
MNKNGRVAVCGSISAYNEDPAKMPKATVLQPTIILKELKIEGFYVSRWSQPKDRWPEAFSNLVQWIKNGQIKVKSHVTEGFDNIYETFIGMLAGENTGKAVVKI